MMVWFRWFSGFQLGEFRFQPLIFPGCKPVMHCYGWSTRRKSSAFWGYQRLKEEAAIPTSGYKSQMRHPMRGVQQYLVDFCGFSSQLNIPVPWILWVWQSAMEFLRLGCFLVVDFFVYPEILGELRSQGWCIFSTKWGAKEAQNPQNHRVAAVVEDSLGILPGPGTWCRFASSLEASSAKVPWFPRSVDIPWDA